MCLFTLGHGSLSDQGLSSPSPAPAFPLSNGHDPVACKREPAQGRGRPGELRPFRPLCRKEVDTSVSAPVLTTPGATQRECQQCPEASLSQCLGLAGNRFLFALEKATCLRWLSPASLTARLLASGKDRDPGQIPMFSEMKEKQWLGLCTTLVVQGETSGLEGRLGPDQDSGRG